MRLHNALFRLAFASAPGVTPLTLPHRSNSSAHSTKGTQSHIPINRHSAFTVCKHTVSGTLSLPFWGTFHHSLTVLIRYRSSRVLSLTQWSGQIPTGFRVSRGTWEIRKEAVCFSPTGLSPSVADLSRVARLNNGFVTPCRFGRNNKRLPQHPLRNGYRLSRGEGLD